MKKEKKFFTTRDVAEIFKITDRHVRRLIKANIIPAKKIGRNFIIEAEQLNPIFQKATTLEKEFVRRTMDKIIKEYGETLRLLGNE